ncbi:DUF2490 domain-containing protein [Nonlabens ponticola]|uniref:DUF2490 domain-containing protein n=1 Tax=Nonlabens ponticola TaxID=2496866 RepID=A0A3S9MUX7_9FLAO|nr:DUF2490 domain-containing protein [Nonlabens ponticola]AZQ42981.1 DUF2490 domain-containing protein [Nonlabens ponticola]
MISCCSKLLILAVLILSGVAHAQIVDQVIAQPAIVLSYRDVPAWKFNTVLQQRNVVYDQTSALHIQIAQFASREIGFYSEIGAGIMYRQGLESSVRDELRTTEQYVHARKYNNLKLAHRLRWDQRWRDEDLTHRWRYRLSGSMPLNGRETNVSEFYATASAEALFIAENKERPAYDQRLSLGIGRQLGKKLKVQLTSQYRWEDYTAINRRSLFLNLSLYHTL